MTTNGSGALCAAMTSRGYKCLNPAKDGRYCPGHTPDNWCLATLPNGLLCRRKKQGDNRCALHR